MPRFPQPLSQNPFNQWSTRIGGAAGIDPSDLVGTLSKDVVAIMGRDYGIDVSASKTDITVGGLFNSSTFPGVEFSFKQRRFARYLVGISKQAAILSIDIVRQGKFANDRFSETEEIYTSALLQTIVAVIEGWTDSGQESQTVSTHAGDEDDDNLKQKINECIGAREYEQALKYADEFVARHPNEAIAFFYRGSALSFIDLEAAVTAYEIAEQLGEAERFPDRIIMMFALDRAECLYKLHRYNEALPIYEKWYQGVNDGLYDLSDMPLMVYCLTLRRLDDYDKAAQIAAMHSPVDGSNKQMFDDLRKEMTERISPAESVFKL